MKTLLRKNKLLLVAMGIVGCVVVISCATGKPGRVEIPTNRLFIAMHPVVKLNPADVERMNEVLRHYDKNLYRIETLENGKVKDKSGSKTFDARLEAELTSAKSRGASGSGIATACPNAACAANQNIASKDRKKFEQLKDILGNYK